MLETLYIACLIVCLTYLLQLMHCKPTANNSLPFYFPYFVKPERNFALIVDKLITYLFLQFLLYCTECLCDILTTSILMAVLSICHPYVEHFQS